MSEEEVTDLDTSTIKENNVEDLCKLIFIDEKSWSMRVVFHEGGGMESRKSDIKSVELPTYRCKFSGKCYKCMLFYQKHME